MLPINHISLLKLYSEICKKFIRKKVKAKFYAKIKDKYHEKILFRTKYAVFLLVLALYGCDKEKICNCTEVTEYSNETETNTNEFSWKYCIYQDSFNIYYK